MSPPKPTFCQRFLLATILAGLHTAFILCIAMDSARYASSHWGRLEWLVPFLIDFPTSLLLSVVPTTRGTTPIFYLIIGILHWGLIGFLIQARWRRARYGKHRPAFFIGQPKELSAQQLASLNESAARDIKLSQTSVNLNDAITVRPVSAESLDVGEE